ncbi:prolipoprotein diacylglyceryl transferase [Desulfoscipio gibsoniae]|uniref:Phosphatidylglycerol--prolipoprotein diacylglyceryl transferase n=1 Tax=Desulfoscipio gibsoniae DSM 7213 TaxID=767817 RepID=R4KRB0_9FIRM|nr:prolipoprotein diacylglyceryl transferase [Desulfoscipio gibsoniae]AGL03105.1 prolipoprotein diacylglyceryl transferase [Desulfoscipio gibsoniae DSM 7213]
MIDPVAVQIGPLAVRWYGIIMATAFLLGIWLAYRRAQQNNIDPNHILNMVTLIIPASIIGARLYYVLFTWENYRLDPLEALAIWHGGLAIHGGIIGGLVAGLFYVYRYGISPWQTADIIAPSLILGQAIGRWGNFINQEAHGGPVTEQFINIFPDFIKNQMFIQGQYYHPTFLYESLWNLMVFIILTLRWPKKKAPGEIAFLYLILYSIGRFFVESLRTDSLMLGPFRVAQLVSVVLILIGTAGLYLLRRKKPRTG